MPFNIAISGLQAATTDLEVTGHNIANAATTGFKESRAEFADIYANTIYDSSQNTSGKGVLFSRVAQLFTQGSVDFTGRNFDLAITGNGFFVTDDASGNRYYTRAGEMSVDREGYVVNHAERRLQVFPVVGDAFDDENLSFNVGQLDDLQLPTTIAAPRATSEMTMGLNLDSTQTVPAVAFDPNTPASYNHSTSTTVYDSLGQAHTSSFYFVKTGANAWSMYTFADDGTGTFQQVNTGDGTAAAAPYPGTSLVFDTGGNLTTPATGTLPFSATTANGSANPLVVTTFDLSGVTQYGSSFDVNNLSQNGYTIGRLTGVDIEQDGVVFARYTNGQSQALGKVVLANFNNPQGLRKSGDTAWEETYSSGAVRFGEPQTSDLGAVQGGALESSNVDLAEQLVKLITAQRNYQANAEVISTADAITQTIINIR